MSMMNRLANCHNRFQGPFRRVLCVCSAGLLRSPTAAIVLSGAPFNFNTRAAGVVSEYALVPVDDALIEWADEIVCMEPTHSRRLKDMAPGKMITCLDIEDRYPYRNPELMRLIAEKYLNVSEYGKTLGIDPKIFAEQALDDPKPS